MLMMPMYAAYMPMMPGLERMCVSQLFWGGLSV